MLPEISRRCLSCGASARAGAHFCPQCGAGMDTKDAPPPAPAEESREEPEPQPEQPAPAVAARVADEDDDLHLKEEWERWQQTIRERRRLREQQQQQEQQKQRQGEGAVVLSPAVDVAAASAGEAGPATPDDGAPAPAWEDGAEAAQQPEAGARWRRAAGAAAAVGESVRPRVERLRDASVYVLEEPPDDSGLSFVLIAAGLFLLFLLFLFLSTVLK